MALPVVLWVLLVRPIELQTARGEEAGGGEEESTAPAPGTGVSPCHARLSHVNGMQLQSFTI